MSFLSAIPIIGKVLDGVFGIIDKSVTDKDEALRLKSALQMGMMNGDHAEVMELLRQQGAIVLAEVNGKSWLQRNWRPLLMMTIVLIIANNFLIFPYVSLFTDKTVILVLPERLYALMTVGVGGYIASRGVEKGIDKWKQNIT
jgi:hypothetical protein